METIINKLESYQVFTLILIFGLTLIYLLYKKNGKIGKYISFEEDKYKKKEVIQNHLLLSEFKEYEEDGVGFFIPDDTIYIFGKHWNLMNDKHFQLITALERDWTSQKKINIRDCNLNSSILNLLENKSHDLKELMIIHNIEQKEILERYFKMNDNVKLKCM